MRSLFLFSQVALAVAVATSATCVEAGPVKDSVKDPKRQEQIRKNIKQEKQFKSREKSQVKRHAKTLETLPEKISAEAMDEVQELYKQAQRTAREAPNEDPLQPIHVQPLAEQGQMPRQGTWLGAIYNYLLGSAQLSSLWKPVTNPVLSSSGTSGQSSGTSGQSSGTSGPVITGQLVANGPVVNTPETIAAYISQPNGKIVECESKIKNNSGPDVSGLASKLADVSLGSKDGDNESNPARPITEPPTPVNPVKQSGNVAAAQKLEPGCSIEATSTIVESAEGSKITYRIEGGFGKGVAIVITDDTAKQLVDISEVDLGPQNQDIADTHTRERRALRERRDLGDSVYDNYRLNATLPSGFPNVFRHAESEYFSPFSFERSYERVYTVEHNDGKVENFYAPIDRTPQVENMKLNNLLGFLGSYRNAWVSENGEIINSYYDGRGFVHISHSGGNSHGVNVGYPSRVSAQDKAAIDWENLQWTYPRTTFMNTPVNVDQTPKRCPKDEATLHCYADLPFTSGMSSDLYHAKTFRFMDLNLARVPVSEIVSNRFRPNNVKWKRRDSRGVESDVPADVDHRVSDWYTEGQLFPNHTRPWNPDKAEFIDMRSTIQPSSQTYSELTVQQSALKDYSYFCTAAVYERTESRAQKGHIQARKVTYSIPSYQVRGWRYNPHATSPRFRFQPYTTTIDITKNSRGVKPGFYSASELEDTSGNINSPVTPILSFRNDDKAVIDLQWVASEPGCFKTNVEVGHGDGLSKDNPDVQADRVKYDVNGLVGEGVEEGVLANVTVSYTPRGGDFAYGEGSVTVNHLKKNETYLVTVTTTLPCSDKEFLPNRLDILEADDMDEEIPMDNHRGKRATTRLELTPGKDITLSEKESVTITNAVTGVSVKKKVEALTDEGRRVNDYASRIAMDRILKAVNER